MVQPSIVIYTRPDCASSSADYRERLVEYTEIDLSKQADLIPALLGVHRRQAGYAGDSR